MRSAEAGAPRHLLHVFSTFAVGGPQVRFAALARLWGDRYRHTILAMDGRYDAWERLGPAIIAERLDMPVKKGRALSLSNLRRFRRMLHELGPDALLTSNFGTIEWALANRLGPEVRHLHMEDGFGPDEADGRQLPRRIRLRRVALGRAEVVVPSRGLERIAREFWKVAPGRVHRIPNGIQVARFADASRSRATGPVPRVVSVGALRAEKNVARLIQAFARLPQDVGAAELLIAGDGPERPALEALAARLGLGARVRFLGQRDDPERVLADAELFALSSDTEQMPLSLIEAMAAGLPVVATDVGDVRDMLAESNRPFVVTSSAEAVAEALAVLLRDEHRRRELGAANQAKARADYDEARMAARYAALIEG